MPDLNGSISLVTGDYKEVRRSISGIPAGETVTKSYLTVKNAASDADTAAIFQKTITSSLDLAQGVIEDSGASGTAVVRFFLLPANTRLLGNPVRAVGGVPYDIQVITSAGKVLTPEVGTLTSTPQITLAES